MIGFNGGLLGIKRSTSTGIASGAWTPNEQVTRKRAGVWPLSGDPYFGYSSLLLHMDGSNGSTTFTDNSSSPLTVTANGNAQISTAQSKFGGASGYFDGSGDYLQIADSTALRFGTGDFTIEAFIRPQSITGTIAVIGTSVGLGRGASLRLTSSAMILDSAGYNSTSAGYSLVLDTWQHLAVVRSGTTVYFFANGIIVGTSTAVNWDFAGPADQVCASTAGGQYVGQFNGWVDEVRLTKGVARYTSAFTPPTAPFPSA